MMLLVLASSLILSSGLVEVLVFAGGVLLFVQVAVYVDNLILS